MMGALFTNLPPPYWSEFHLRYIPWHECPSCGKRWSGSHTLHCAMPSVSLCDNCYWQAREAQP